MIKKIWLVPFLLVCIVTGTAAQNVNLQEIKNKLYLVNKSFDSAQYLAFDVEIQFSSDTVNGHFETDFQTANYAMHKRNIYVNVGGTEFMQNELFSITAYNNEQTMMVNRQKKKNSSFFPLKEFVDSTLNYFSNYYTITNDSANHTEYIDFVTDSANVLYKTMRISFEPRHHLLSRIEMSFLQPFNNEDVKTTGDSTSTAMPAVMVKKYIQMDFKNYHFLQNLDLFDQTKYIFYDRQRKEYTAAGKYLGYKIYASSISNE